MEAHREPPLNPAVRESIVYDQYEVSKKYWRQLQQLKASYDPATINLFAEMAGDKIRPKEPPMPKQPIRLCNTLVRYAKELFDCEDRHYPNFAQGIDELMAWRLGLAVKAENLVMSNVEQLEKSFAFLSFHAPYELMRSKLSAGLQAHVEELRSQIKQTTSKGTPTATPPDMIEPSKAAVAELLRVPNEQKLVLGKATAEHTTARQIIDAFCDKAGCSLDTLAEKAGVDRRQVFRVRSGKRVRRDALAAIAGALGVEPSRLKPTT